MSHLLNLNIDQMFSFKLFDQLIKLNNISIQWYSSVNKERLVILITLLCQIKIQLKFITSIDPSQYLRWFWLSKNQRSL